MEYINKIEIRGVVGNAGITTVGQTKVARFSVATNYSYENQPGGIIIDTTWFTVTAWDKPQVADAFIAKKGDWVHVKGRVRVQGYIAADGSDRTAFEVIAQDVKLIRED